MLSTFDWIIVCFFTFLILFFGLVVSKNSSKDSKQYFLSGRNLPWWLLGVSMVATTFSADTPNLVTEIVRKDGIAGNWQWWAFSLTGMMTVFFYSKLWRRSKVLTDLEFYEKRYSGKEAAFLRAFRAIYLGLFFNVIIMASVSLAGIKIGGLLLDMSPVECVLFTSFFTVIYSTLGGLRSVIFTDFIQFILAMIGSVWACIYIVSMDEIGGLTSLFSHSNVEGKLNFFPDIDDYKSLFSLFIIPIAVQWWSVWYPGAEPGGGGYIAQRMLSAKNENHALKATLLFNVFHYALRPWPWILIALSSLIIFPDLDDISKTFPHLDLNVIGDDLAYPAMLSNLPSGLLGLILASLIAALMSTLSSHLNWGSSYLSLDFYKRFINRDATENQIVNVGKISTILLMFISSIIALYLDSALSAFKILLQIGAGTGLIFILRWFWWRINAYTEISGMIVSFLIALYFEFFHEIIFSFKLNTDEQLITGVFITTTSWLLVTYFTKPTDIIKLSEFYNLVKPKGVGWNGFLKLAKKNNIKINKQRGSFIPNFISMLLGIVIIYCSLFLIGFILYNNFFVSLILFLIIMISILMLIRNMQTNYNY
tara:strand:- start:7465 stop:9246 length:1782 start_codon:yes stop_codon:yes gene_type:complete